MPYCNPDSLTSAEDYAATLSRFLPNAGTVFVEEALRATLQDIVSSSRNLKEIIDIDAQAGVSPYQIKTIDCSEVIGINSVTVNGVCINPIDACSLSFCGCANNGCERCRSYMTNSFASRRGGYVARPNDFIEIYPAPTRDTIGGIQVEAVVTLSPDACEFPSSLINRYPRAIQYGVLGELFMMQSEAWYSMATALRYIRLYKDEIKNIQDAAFLDSHPEGVIHVASRNSI